MVEANLSAEARPTVVHPTRADALRNREKILETARSQIVEHGPDVGMSQIAQAAGVAVGTLYRHFPTKTDLVKAVISEQVDRLADAAEEAWARVETGRSEPTVEILTYLRDMVETAANNGALRVAAQNLVVEIHRSDSARRGAAALARLIERGRNTGCLRPDLTVTDLYLLAATGPLEHPEASRERWLELIMPALLPFESSSLNQTQKGA